MSDNSSTPDIVPGDRVIWRRDGDEWTVDQIKDDGHVKPLVLLHRMFGGEGPIEIANARYDDVVRISR